MIKRKLRTKSNNDEEANIDTNSSISVVKSEESGKDKKKRAKGKGKVILSFGADEEEQEETFQITKSAASRRLAKSKSKKLFIDHESIPQNSDQTIAPSYTEEILSALRASTPATPISFQSQDNLGNFQPTLDTEPTFGIPDASAISAAKKEREMRRKKGLSGAPDYIPLSEDTDVTTTSGKKMESRLIREEDELGEADEELERYMDEKLAIGKNAKKEQERRKKADIEEMIMDVDFEEEDDELLQWELEAMKAGGHVPKKPSKRNLDLKQQTRIPTIVPIPTLNEVQSLLDSQLANLQELHNNHQAELIQIQREIDSLTSSNVQMENEIQNTKRRYNYFQEFKTFVENLVEFLDDKFPILEKLEKDYQDLLIERSQLILQRIIADDSDDIALFTMGDIDKIVKQEQEVDEFGGVSNTISQQRRQQRDRRRFLRKSNIPSNELEEEGFSTDDGLSKSDEREISKKMDEISYHHTSLFEDVIEDFKSIASIKSKFVSWKTEFNDDYTKAFGGLSLPGVFEFYIRYEIMLWSISKDIDFNNMEWYKVISEYSASESNESNTSQPDDDFTVLGKVLEKILLPRIACLVKTLNPYSSKQTTAFIEIFEKDVITAVSERLRDVVTSLETIPEIPILDSNDSISIARNRYFWRKYKLLKNIIMWKEFVSVDILRFLSIDYLLSRYLLHILSNSSSTTESSKYQKILEIVPSDWLPPFSLERIARGAAGF